MFHIEFVGMFKICHHHRHGRYNPGWVLFLLKTTPLSGTVKGDIFPVTNTDVVEICHLTIFNIPNSSDSPVVFMK
jgi:hypothetical protein